MEEKCFICNRYILRNYKTMIYKDGKEVKLCPKCFKAWKQINATTKAE